MSSSSESRTCVSRMRNLLSCARQLGLRNPIYEKTAAYGHFGRPDFPWEQPKKLTL